MSKTLVANGKDIAAMALENQKELLINGSAGREIFQQLKFADMNVIENDLVPPGQFLIVDKQAQNRFREFYECKFDDMMLDATALGDAYKTQMTATMAMQQKDVFDEKMLLAAMGKLKANDKWLEDAHNVPVDACDACKGRGVYNNEECWHCGGEGTDPTK